MKKQNRVKALSGKMVYLSPISSGDALEYYDQLFERETRRLTGTKRLFSVEQVSAFLNEESSSSSSVLLFIILHSNDEIIGDIAFQDIDFSNRKASFRISIDQNQHQGKGYGSEALRLMLEYGFGILNLHRIELEVFSFNDRAQHVYEKAGFKIEGRQRDALYYNHQYHDSILMSMLEDEYRAKYSISNM